MSHAIVIFCTCPDEATADRLATEMVENRHAACVNILPGLRSVYRWQDTVEREQEVLLIIKTTPSHFFVLEHWLEEHHPYDVPELLAVRADRVGDAYLQWLQQSVAT